MNFLLLPTWHSQRIAETERTVEKTAGKVAAGQDATDDLRRRVETLALANQALFEILSERLGITEDDVMSRMLAIDVRDGKKDGKITGKAAPCKQCRRTINTSRRHCMYCGAPIKEGAAFGKV